VLNFIWACLLLGAIATDLYANGATIAKLHEENKVSEGGQTFFESYKEIQRVWFCIVIGMYALAFICFCLFLYGWSYSQDQALKVVGIGLVAILYSYGNLCPHVPLKMNSSLPVSP